MSDKLIKLLFLKVNKLRKIGEGVSGFPYMDFEISNYSPSVRIFYREKGFPEKKKGKKEYLGYLEAKTDADLIEMIELADQFIKKGKDLKTKWKEGPERTIGFTLHNRKHIDSQ